jgi:hypothetical protein
MPIHTRSSIGVSAAVGTELGSYSSARAATNERQRDRENLWTVNSDSNASFERAAELGKKDALAYSYGDGEEADDPWVVPVVDTDRDKTTTETSYYLDGAADALTVGSADLLDDNEYNENISSNDIPTSPVVLSYQSISEQTPDKLKSIYATIQANKAKQQVVFTKQTEDESKPDPGYRIYHVDETTGEEREIPPYTSPGEFLASIETSKTKDIKSIRPETTDQTDYDETTYDGYQEIQKSNARNYREEELEIMREARRKNRLGQSDIDYSKIGAQRM